MLEFINKNSCINCKYFCQYYVKYKEEFKPVSCGFCSNEALSQPAREWHMLNLSICKFYSQFSNDCKNSE